MKTKLTQIWINWRSSFWFIPALMILAAVVFAFFMVEVDAHFGVDVASRFPRIFGANAEGARSILSAVANSMIGIAGVTFSITIVTLSLASVQYTSRILRNFMRDRANQTVLGVFVSIFVYCLVVLRTIRGGEESFVPSLAVAMGIVLGVVGIGFLIFFIHHVATSIQASTIISNISEETLAVIDRLYPDPDTNKEENPREAGQLIEENTWTDIPARRTGYLLNVDHEALMDWAEHHHTIVRMMRGIGEFVIAGKPILNIILKKIPPGDAVAELNACFSVASFRTIEQDAAFGIRQLVDISLKALSPGVNDTTTAVTCLNYLGAILERLAGRKIPTKVCRRKDKVRLVARTHNFPYFAGQCLNQIRQDARGNVSIHLAMLNTIAPAARPELSESRRKALHEHLARIKRVVHENVKDPDDMEAIRDRLQKSEALLKTRG